MSRSHSIPEELIKIKADQIGKKCKSNSTPERNWAEAVDYLQKHQWEVFWWKVKHPDSHDFALDIVKTFISALGLTATVIAGLALFLNYWAAEKDRQLLCYPSK